MSDVRALLLTDVVDSTRLSAELGDRGMAEIWVAHDRLARDLLPVWRGQEIDKTDGMLVLFNSAADAVHYVLAYHRALSALHVGLSARAGLHVGPVTLRKNSAADVARGAKPLEVDGLAKPTAARVMSLASGGQTLLSDEARRTLGEGDWALQSYGHWMLKGLADPVELFELATDPGAFATAADNEKAFRVFWSGERWLPVRQIPNNLPQQLTSFVGRERERREVRFELEKSSRLITLLGMGGMGKTRLSLQVATDVMVSFPDGVWFLDLAPIRDPAFVVGRAAQMLDVREEPHRSIVQTLCAALRPKRALLIFDNCEHLIQASAELADAILRAAPQVCVLATSREALRIPGEQSYPVLPLPGPKPGDGLEALSRSIAVRLFLERARTHNSKFALTEREAPALAELVARLEGIPLALELAAARVRAMNIADINARLRDRYKLLTGGGRVLRQSHQTLRALVDWSYYLLDESERAVLNRLAVFIGGFDIEAAEEVCGAEPSERPQVLDIVTSLVEKSLVAIDARARGSRFRMLETIREYAREKLESSGDAASAVARHCQHYFRFARAVKLGIDGPEMPLWIERMEAEFDNVRAGTSAALVGQVDPIIAVKYCVAMQTFWIVRGYATEGRNTIRAALVLAPIRSSEMALGHTLYVGAALAESQSDYGEALTMLAQCLELRRGLGDLKDTAGTLSTLALVQLATGDAGLARQSELEALAMFRELGFSFGEAIVLLQLAQIEAWVGDDARAREYLDACLGIARQLGNREIEADGELVVGDLAFERGDQRGAREHFMVSLAICQNAAHKRGEANAVWRLAKVDLDEDALPSASAGLGTALQAFRSFEMRKELLGCLEDHVCLLHAWGLTDAAVRIASAAVAARSDLQIIRPPNYELRWQAQLELLRKATTDIAFSAAWDDGRTWSIERAARVAVSTSDNSGPPS